MYCQGLYIFKRLSQRNGWNENWPSIDAKLVKKFWYKIAHKYKEIVKKEIDSMLDVGIIYHIHLSEWASHMAIQPKKYDLEKLRIYVNFQWLNKVTIIDPFPTPFDDEIINQVVGHECYFFMDGFSGYNQVDISKED